MPDPTPSREPEGPRPEKGGDEQELRDRLHDLWAGGRREDSDLPESYHQAVDESIDAMLEMIAAMDARPSLSLSREEAEAGVMLLEAWIPQATPATTSLLAKLRSYLEGEGE